MAIVALSTPSLIQKLAVVWLLLLLLLAVVAPVLPLTYSPSVPDLAHVAQPPFAGPHWLGTDAQGRDVLSVLVFGARTAVALTLPAALLATLLGAAAGGAAGFWGNRARLPVPYWFFLAGLGWWAAGLPGAWAGVAVAAGGALWARQARGRSGVAWPVPVDAIVVGVATLLDAIPRLVLAVTVAATTGLSWPGLLALLALTAWPHPARLVRAQMQRVRVLPFIEAMRAAGVPAGRIWVKHAMPHAILPLQTVFPLSVATLLGLESTLSFLGIGLPPDVASWGRLLGTVRDEPSTWWAFLFPSIILVISILSLYALSVIRKNSV